MPPIATSTSAVPDVASQKTIGEEEAARMPAGPKITGEEDLVTPSVAVSPAAGVEEILYGSSTTPYQEHRRYYVLKKRQTAQTIEASPPTKRKKRKAGKCDSAFGDLKNYKESGRFIASHRS